MFHKLIAQLLIPLSAVTITNASIAVYSTESQHAEEVFK